jgi:hypothetical protein
MPKRKTDNPGEAAQTRRAAGQFPALESDRLLNIRAGRTSIRGNSSPAQAAPREGLRLPRTAFPAAGATVYLLFSIGSACLRCISAFTDSGANLLVRGPLVGFPWHALADLFEALLAELLVFLL